jgi:hypothetical protein
VLTLKALLCISASLVFDDCLGRLFLANLIRRLLSHELPVFCSRFHDDICIILCAINCLVVYVCVSENWKDVHLL